jgi:drug/metabolite transporter (DMT)-like permease
LTDNVRAALLMIVTMAGFALEDLLIKILSARMPVGQILLVLGFAGSLVMFVMARLGRSRLLDPALLERPVLIRSGAELIGQILGFSALTLLPLSVFTSIGQAAPIVTTLGAALFLREEVGWRRWSAVFVGLIGVLLILRPGSAAFHPAMILVALSVVCFAARDLSTRHISRGLTVMQLNFWGYATTLPAGLLLLATSGLPAVWPTPVEALMLLATLALGISFYWTLTVALRMGESSVVVPFRYTRLVFVLILAAIFLGERPSATMLTGTALVTLAGLYTLIREARLKRRLRPSPDPLAQV